jgi:hypothetical protein
MYAKANLEGNQYLLLESVLDHYSNKDAVKQRDGYRDHNGKRARKKITKG